MKYFSNCYIPTTRTGLRDQASIWSTLAMACAPSGKGRGHLNWGLLRPTNPLPILYGAPSCLILEFGVDGGGGNVFMSKVLLYLIQVPRLAIHTGSGTVP